jgi:drug/metabolite transporter (DMT)-like permease
MCVIWGIPYLLIRIAVRQLSPADLVFARTAPAALLLLPLALREHMLRPVLRRWVTVVLYTAAELAVPWVFLASAEKRLSSSLSSLLVATVPSAGLVIGRLSGTAERLDRRRVSGLVAGLVGVSVLVGVDVRGAGAGSLAEMAVVVVGYSVGPMIISRSMSDLPGVGVVTASLGITAVAYAPWTFTHWPQHLSFEVLGAVATLAVVCTAVAFVLFFQLIAEVGPSRATVITYVNPAVAVLLGVSVLGERMTWGTAAGFPLVLVGSVLASASSAGVDPEPTPLAS